LIGRPIIQIDQEMLALVESQIEPNQFTPECFSVLGIDLQRVPAQLSLDMLGRTLHRDPAMVEDKDAVGALCLLQIVGGEDDGDLTALADIGQIRP
jgi:hypothetical protein